MTGIRYPRRLELSRLEPLGDPAYFDTDEAEQRYRAGQSLTVLPEGQSPTWFLSISPGRARFSLTFHTASGTPVRSAVWEAEGDRLICRRITDLFYPDGDPGRRVPYMQIISVVQEISTDGVVGVTFSCPPDHDDYREASDVPLERFRADVPAFGEWEALNDASAPAPLERFGRDARQAALAYARAGIRSGSSPGGDGPSRSGWRTSAGDRGIMNAADAIVSGRAASAEIVVLARGDVRILPLAVQADPADSRRDPREEQRRMTALAADVRGACEYRAGRSIAIDLERHGDDRPASYASSLRASGATNAEFWVYDGHGVVSVWTGAVETGDLLLALHVVPENWVSLHRREESIVGVELDWSISDIVNHRA